MSFYCNILLFTDLYEPIINANRIENPERRMLMVKKLLHELPEAYFETFRYIAKHLHTITNNETNKVGNATKWKYSTARKNVLATDPYFVEQPLKLTSKSYLRLK